MSLPTFRQASIPEKHKTINLKNKSKKNIEN